MDNTSFTWYPDMVDTSHDSGSNLKGKHNEE